MCVSFRNYQDRKSIKTSIWDGQAFGAGITRSREREKEKERNDQKNGILRGDGWEKGRLGGREGGLEDSVW